MMYLTFRKRACVIFLLLNLLCACTLSGQAETLYVHGISDLNYDDEAQRIEPQWYSAFQEEYPDIMLSVDQQEYYESAQSVLSTLESSSQTDVFTISSLYQDLPTIMASGACMDLSAVESLGAIIEQIYPAYASAAFYDGKLYGIPIDVSPASYLMYNETAWEEAGFTDADVPASYNDLLDFLSDWVERVKADPEEQFCINNMFDAQQYQSGSYMEWLVSLLVRNYAIQCAYQQTPIQFGTPEMIALLQKTSGIGEALYRYDNVQNKQALLEEVSGSVTGLAHLIP